MPREQITYDTPPPLPVGEIIRLDEPQPVPESVPVPIRPSLLHVGWEKAPTGHVQFSLAVDVVAVKAAGSDTDGWDTGVDNRVMFWTDILDRAELNRLITTLRRARDQAYGADA